MPSLSNSICTYFVWPFFTLIFIGLSPSLFSQNEVKKLKFNQDIRPILSGTCFRCHGFDNKTREADLRLDSEEAAYTNRPNGKPAISPGKLDASLVWERIQSTDPDSVMPPPSSNRQLSEEEKKTIAQWIEQGAQYEKHWSFQPIPESPLPSIDYWLDKGIQSKGLQTQGQTDQVTLVRRLAFTLTGLPPEQSDVNSLVADPSEANYQKLVDRYLSSQHFGEEMAKHWLDVARYGDTHGLHLDNERQAWAYRDWVVDAFNRNLPFSQFTIEQLAGDLLPSPTQSQLVATGFNRSNVTTSEGGAINEEFLYRYAVDRTSTTIQAWLGLTGGCAVCHDHKYDPISTREFYSMYAFFYSAADPAMDGNTNTTRPFLKLTSEQQTKELTLAKENEERALERLKTVAVDNETKAQELRLREQKGQQRNGREEDDPKLDPKSAFQEPVSLVLMDDDFSVGATLRNTTRNEAIWSTEDNAPMGTRSLRQAFGHKYEQSISGGLQVAWIPEKGNLRVWLKTDIYEPPKLVFVELKVEKKTMRWDWTNQPEQASQYGGDIKQVVGQLPQPGKWTELSVPLDGLPAGERITQLKLGLFGGSCNWDGVTVHGLSRPEHNLTTELLAWWKASKGTDMPMASGKLAKAIKEGPESESGKSMAGEVEDFFRTYVGSEVASTVLEARRNWLAARVYRSTVESRIPGTFIFNDLDKPRDAFVMTRGQYDQKGEKVLPGTPAVFPKLRLSNANKSEPNLQSVGESSEGLPRVPNRLDLAQWLVSDENPLTARVTVNRFWQQVFGVGLVKTSDDFGSQGAPPTHPELLDQLSNQFRKNGWNVKELMRQMVTSQAFRRAAVVDDKSLKLDPENRYYARGPRIRLDAEQIRDNVLAVSGLLNRKMAGPGIKGYQPPNIWEPVGYGDSNTRYYIQDHGDDLYRRSLYSFIKRTAPPPFMSNFDAPNREMFCTRRERSNTPLQALQLMNDVQYVEAARKMAERLVKDYPKNLDDRITAAFERATSRKPTTKEHSTLRKAYDSFLAKFASSPNEAKKLLWVGEKPHDPSLDAVDVAANTLLSNLILNLDEVVNRN